MMKLYENCQRMIVIAYANEMANACTARGINPFEVAAAAATKPCGYLPVYPSVGGGGHCIPVNPHYLFSTSEFPILKTATRAMEKRPAMLAKRLLDRLSQYGVLLREPFCLRPRVLVVGVGFKPGQSHIVNSPGVGLALALAEKGNVDVMFLDPLVPQHDLPSIPRVDERYWDKKVLGTFDGIVVCMQQPGLDMEVLDSLEHVQVENWCNRIGVM
jgi:nucleotide sugar dehydrogenase